MHLHIHAEKDIVRILFAFYSLSQEQKRIRARLAATSAGTNHLACLTRVVIVDRDLEQLARMPGRRQYLSFSYPQCGIL